MTSPKGAGVGLWLHEVSVVTWHRLTLSLYRRLPHTSPIKDDSLPQRNKVDHADQIHSDREEDYDCSELQASYSRFVEHTNSPSADDRQEETNNEYETGLVTIERIRELQDKMPGHDCAWCWGITGREDGRCSTITNPKGIAQQAT